MSQSNIHIPPEFVRQVDARIRLRADLSHAHNNINQLNQLSSQVPTHGTAQTIALADANTTPPQKVAMVLPILQQELTEIRRIETTIQEQHKAIEEIKRKAKNLMITLISVGVAAVLILVVVLLFATHIL